MHCNMGSSDKIFRGMVGLAILTIGALLQSWWGLLGILPLGSSLAGRCPAYLPLKINTDKNKD